MEAVGWSRKLLRRRADIAWSAREWAKVGDRPYFALPLQLDSDYQLRVHSPFGNMRAALYFVMKSFAHHAPPHVALVIKRHPLDAGLIAWDRMIRKLARRFGIADRVHYLAEQNIDEVVGGAIGVVTVNSTVGTLALNSHKPVVVLGHAVYKVPGIVYTGSLDQFWRDPRAPDLTLYAAFRRVLVHRCLIRGGLLSEEGLKMLVDNAVARLTAPPRPVAEQAAPRIRHRPRVVRPSAA